ncbi:uncharacterized protein F4822DRAFT_435486 [Hypoxylon trugodes]|uniref:uncharacterized protein n=1 Tax=Hypoxylon trugodes TaxID=326681 RepID=UPI00219261E0|nr:uncharacterized protein F4822DRAFT_435486 [Hypoxylon trugodes]KAI1382528.1 hypothetical protein F4822DRAFT_435486 [Hypoxylon trugodes]
MASPAEVQIQQDVVGEDDYVLLRELSKSSRSVVQYVGPTGRHQQAKIYILLKHVPSGPSHVLVHHLFTGMYQCLRPKGSSSHENKATEFATSIRTYAVAQEYELPTLEELAKNKTERLGHHLQMAQFLNIMMDAYPTHRSNNVWLHNYIKPQVESLIHGPADFLMNGSSESSGQTLSITSVLLGASRRMK